MSTINSTPTQLLFNNFDLTVHTLTFLTRPEIQATSTVSKFIQKCFRTAIHDQFKELFEHKKLSIENLENYQRSLRCRSLIHLLGSVPNKFKDKITELDMCRSYDLPAPHVDQDTLRRLIPMFSNLTHLQISNDEDALNVVDLCKSQVQYISFKDLDHLNFDRSNNVLVKIIQKFPIQKRLHFLHSNQDTPITFAADKYRDHLTQVKIVFANNDPQPTLIAERVIYLLETCQKLQSVDIDGCTHELLQKIGSNCPNLTDLDVSLINPVENGEDDEDDEEDRFNEEIRTLVGQCPFLTRLAFANYNDDNSLLKISGETCQAIANSCPNLKILVLDMTIYSPRELSPSGLVDIARKCRQLSHLTLTDVRNQTLYSMATHLNELTSFTHDTFLERGFSALSLCCRKLTSISTFDRKKVIISPSKLPYPKSELDRQALERNLSHEPKTPFGKDYREALRDVVFYSRNIDMKTILDRDLFLHFDIFHGKAIILKAKKEMILSKYSALTDRQCKYIQVNVELSDTQIWCLSCIKNLHGNSTGLSKSASDSLGYVNYTALADAVYLAGEQKK